MKREAPGRVATEQLLLCGIRYNRREARQPSSKRIISSFELYQTRTCSSDRWKRKKVRLDRLVRLARNTDLPERRP